MGVMRLGYVHVRVTDLDAAGAHYGETLGMRLVAKDADHLYFKAWDEWDHHSVILEQGGAGVVKFGFKCASPDDIDACENRIARFGCHTERMSQGENPHVGDGLRVVLPSEHVIELYAEMEQVGTEVGTMNPAPFPRHLVGVGVPRLDHAFVTCQKPIELERFFAECLGFRASERVVTETGRDGELVSSFMACSNAPHDFAFIQGPNGKLHHFAYLMTDWNAIRRSGDILSMDDVQVDIGPTRHGITRGRRSTSSIPPATATRSSPAATRPSRTSRRSPGRWRRSAVASTTSPTRSTSGSPRW